MHFVSYRHKEKDGWGVINDGTIVDLGSIATSLKSAIAAASLPANSGEIPDNAAVFSAGDVTLLPPVPDPARILCVGQNYVAHRREMQGLTTASPLIFTRYPSSIIGHNEMLIKPPESEQFDYEGELAVIISKPGRRISADRALEHIAGYSCFMDGSMRDFQNHTTQYIPGKNFDQSGAFGPWMTAAGDIVDPNGGLRLQTRLNGETVQQTTTDLMLFDIATVIAYLSIFTTLEPGDVIATGTPGGVGYKRQPQLFMQAGDRIEVEIDNVGTLSNVVSGA